MKKNVERPNRKTSRYATSLMGAAAMTVFVPSMAFGQTQPATPAPTEQPPPDTIQTPPPAAPADADESIVVTGSRVRSEFNSSSPIQVILPEVSALAGVSDTAEMIQNSSVAAGSPQNNATISSVFVTEGGPGSETVSLRGLGANRTLVLLNGRRAGPAGTRGQVSAFDLNVLPFSAIERVEVLKDGASSVYGSDAVAGVVNIITKHNFDGGDANLSYSHPGDPGGEQFDGNLTWGHTFSRGYISATLDYFHQKETLSGQRPYTNCGTDNTYSVATGLRNDVVDPRTGQFACRSNTATGLVWLYDYSYEYQLNPGANYMQYDGSGRIGTLLPQTIVPPPLTPAGPTVPNNWFNVNQDLATAGVVDSNSPFEQNSSLTPDIQRTTFFAQGGFNIAPNIQAYSEVLMNRRESSTNGFRQVWTYLYSTDGPFGGADPFSAGWTGDALLSPTVTTDHNDASQTVDYTRIVAGLKGNFDGWLGDIDWDVYVQSSVSDASYSQDVILQDAVYSSDGRSDTGSSGLFHANSIPRPTASCAGYTTPISGRPCVDVNWLSQTLVSGGGFSPAEEAFLYNTETGHTKYVQRYIEGSLNGDIFHLPAGNVGAAVGFVYRTDQINDTPGAVTLEGNNWGFSTAGITKGRDTTSEVYGEAVVPILRDAPLATSLTLTLSGRYTDVRSYGTNSTYKVGLAWQVTPEFLVRYTQGTSFRAPALYELYLADQTSFPRQSAVDPCIRWQQQLAVGNIPQRVADNCAFSGGPNPVGGIPGTYTGAGASVTAHSRGGLGLLQAETSEAKVFGVAWSPGFLPVSIALDYFQIDVENEVSQIGSQAIVFGCYNSVNFPTDPLCSLFQRGIGLNPFLIDTVNNSYLNVNSQTNTGLDLTFRYHRPTPWGEFSIQSQVTWQFDDTTALFAGTERDNNGTNSDPTWTGDLDFQLTNDKWTYFWGVNMIGSSSDRGITADTNPTNTTRYDLRADYTVYHALSVKRDFDTWSLLAGVANIFDQEPPTVSTVGGAVQNTIGPSVLASQYDYLGRRAFVRVSKNF